MFAFTGRITTWNILARFDETDFTLIVLDISDEEHFYDHKNGEWHGGDDSWQQSFNRSHSIQRSYWSTRWVPHSITHFSYLFTFNVDAFELAKQKNFALDIPQENQASQTKFRIVKKAFAIACQTTMSSEINLMENTNTQWCIIWSVIEEQILKHLKGLFYGRIRYICISSPRNPSSNSDVVYIQITFHRVVSKKEYFMKRVAGSYKVFPLALSIPLLKMVHIFLIDPL